MALLRPPHLKAMMCNKGGFWNAHTSGVRQGGAYEARQWVWGVKNASRKEPRMREALEHIEKTFDGWMRRYPFIRGSSPLSITPEYENYIFDQAEQSDYNDYWKQIGLNTEEYIDQFADIPALFLSGWYDIYARSTIDFFTHLQPRKKGPILLIMGPWQHVGAEGHVAGEVDFGVNALVSGNLAPNMFSLSRRWFDRWVDPASQPQPRRMTAQEKLALAIQVAEEQQEKKEKSDKGDGGATGEEPVSGGGSSAGERVYEWRLTFTQQSIQQRQRWEWRRITLVTHGHHTPSRPVHLALTHLRLLTLPLTTSSPSHLRPFTLHPTVHGATSTHRASPATGATRTLLSYGWR